MSKPRKLYEYDVHHNLVKHTFGPDCNPQPIKVCPDGTRFRCRTQDHDCYGWDTLRAAKFDEIVRVHKEIYELKQHLKNL